MYVATVKLAHGLIRKYGQPTRTLWEALARLEWAKADWCSRGYSILQSVSYEAVILDDETRAAGVLQVKRLPIP